MQHKPTHVRVDVLIERKIAQALKISRKARRQALEAIHADRAQATEDIIAAGLKAMKREGKLLCQV